MQKTVIEKLCLRNFMGAPILEFDINGQNVNFRGTNRAGKSRTEDAWNWLITGKDSQGRADFDAKAKDSQGNFIKDLPAEVSATISTNGIKTELKRVLKEKYTKKRNSTDLEFSGNETLYYVNDVPYKESDYKLEVAKLFGSEDRAILLSNIQHFVKKTWQEQRTILMGLTNILGDSVIFEQMELSGEYNLEHVNTVKDELSKGKTLEQYKAQITEKAKLVRNDIQNIPVRIEEVNRGINKDHNFNAIRQEVVNIENQIDLVDKEISNQLSSLSLQKQAESEAIEAQMKVIRSKTQEKHELEQKLDSLKRNRLSVINAEKSDVQLKIQQQQGAVNALKNAVTNLVNEISQAKQKEVSINESLKSLIELWKQENGKQFNESTQDKCPTCLREYDQQVLQQQIETAQANFNTKKVEAVKKVTEQGNAKKQELLAHQQSIIVLEQELTRRNGEVVSAEGVLKSLQETIANIESKLQLMQPTQDEIDLEKIISEFVIPTVQPVANDASSTVSQELTSKKQVLQDKLKELNVVMAIESANSSAEKRVNELLEQLRVLRAEQTRYEGLLFVMERFNKIRVQSVEDGVNGMFSFVQFKLFETQVNGAEVETCKAMVDGVNYVKTNTASKINAGIDIINTLSRHYSVYMPIFIDNCESIFNILPTDSQTITLTADKAYESLTMVL
jgi:exonuclease SbcC